ncbi:AAA family ATPase [Streptomyces sp. NPDC101181]|uniref:AAA family ATPase n=1 Tax=Streptomyces sp. NPDC101181 TaxID=3366125 RepID=UPI00380A1F5E
MTPALFGRDHPSGVLRAEIARATDSHGGLVLVTGEAGIGKTTLVTDAAHEARRRGALVVGGSCWDSDSTPGYWPWVQVLRALRRSATAAEWAAAQEASDGRLGVLLGDPGAGTHGSPVPHGNAEPLTTGPGAGPGPGTGAGPATPAGTPAGIAAGSGAVVGLGASAGPGAAAASGAGIGAVEGVGAVEVIGAGAVLGSGGVEGVEAFGLFDAVTTALVTISQSRPLVVVLDDLHSADPASLRLLEFAAQHAWFERLLLVGTYRDVEVDAPGHPLQALILPLVSRASTTLTLTGLGRAEVGALMTVTTGREPAPALIDEVHRRTGGNPFFVEQTARLWHSGSPVSTIPPGVREAVRQRLALLPDPVVSLLTAAAVLGREFRRQVLAVVHGAPVAHVDRLLESAVVARVVVPRPSGQYAFAHDLLRETLYASLGDEEARRHHADVVRALDAHGGFDAAVHPGDLARHAHLSGGELERDRRIDLLLAAARDASGRLAEEEALSHYRRALTVADTADEGPDPRRTALICLDLAGQLRHAGEEAEARRHLDRAVDLARELDEPELLARVAITLYRDGSLGGRDASAGGLLAEAHRRITGKEGQDGVSDDRLAQELAIHIMALARSGSDDEALAFSLWARHDSVWGLGSAVERIGLTDEMTVVGRRTQHQDMELHATSMRWVALLELGDPTFLDQFRAFVRLAERTDLPRFALSVAVDSSLIASLQGRFAEAAAALDDDSLDPDNNDHAAFGFMGHHLHWALHLIQGHFAEAEEVLAGLPSRGYPHPALLDAVTAVEQGDATPGLRLVAEHEERAAPYPRAFMPLWLRLLAQTAAATGDPRLIARAEDELTPYTGQWVVSLYGCDIGGPVDLWLGMLAAARADRDEAVAALTEAAASADRLGARPWAVRARLHLARTLLAHADTNGADDARQARRLLTAVVREAKELGLDHLAAEAATLLGRPDAHAPITPETPVPPTTVLGPIGPILSNVSALSDSAMLSNACADPGAPAGTPFTAEDHPGERDPGPTPEPHSASGEEPESGPPPQQAPAPEARPAPNSAPGPDAEPGPRPSPESGPGSGPAPENGPGRGVGASPSPTAEFRRNGPVWQLCWDGVTVHVPDAKGLRDLHSLLGQPGADIPAAHLLAPEGGGLVVAAGQLGGDPVLDEEAKRQYKRHLDRLDAEIDRAAARDDVRLVEKYDRERQALLDELRTAAGLGGRTRRLGDQTERARKTVTARIRDTLRKLDALHPALADHLKASVTTGTTCAYRPAHTPRWRL